MGLTGAVVLVLNICLLAGLLRRDSEPWAWAALVLLWAGGTWAGLVNSVLASIALTLACAKLRALRERPPAP